MVNVRFKDLPIIQCFSVPSKGLNSISKPIPPLNPQLMIYLPTIEEIRNKYKPSILSPLRKTGIF